jgi:hypothetical protein
MARVIRTTLAALAVLASALVGVAPSAADPTGVTVDEECFFQRSQTAPAIANQSTIVIAPGDYLNVRMIYSARDAGSSSLYLVDFTSTLATNPLTGTSSVIDVTGPGEVGGGGGLSVSVDHDYAFDTSGWTTGSSGTLNVTIGAAWAGGQEQSSCSINVLVRDPNGDEDGDGLLNSWETVGIDGNGDGRPT